MGETMLSWFFHNLWQFVDVGHILECVKNLHAALSLKVQSIYTLGRTVPPREVNIWLFHKRYLYLFQKGCRLPLPMHRNGKHSSDPITYKSPWNTITKTIGMMFLPYMHTTSIHDLSSVKNEIIYHNKESELLILSEHLRASSVDAASRMEESINWRFPNGIFNCKKMLAIIQSVDVAIISISTNLAVAESTSILAPNLIPCLCDWISHTHNSHFFAHPCKWSFWSIETLWKNGGRRAELEMLVTCCHMLPWYWRR